MGDINEEKKASSAVSIVGSPPTEANQGNYELYRASVVLKDDGSYRLLVDAQTTPVPLGQLFNENVENGGSPDLTINGGGGTSFTLPLINEDRIISSIVFYGRDSGIKFGKFLGNNAELTTGIQVNVKSEDETFTFLPIKSTDDFRNKFARTPSDFVIDFASGEDAFTATFIPAAPFYIRKQTQFSTPDFIEVVINDNLNGINYLECLVRGAID